MATKAPTPAVLSLQEVVKSFGAQPVLDHVSFTLHEGDRIGLIGRNGSGKSTLLRLMAGLEEPDTGVVTRMQGLRVALLSQACALPRDMRVGEALECAHAELRQVHNAYRALAEEIAHTPPGTVRYRELETQSERLHHALDIAGAWYPGVDLKRISQALRMPAPERRVGDLSGGEMRRVDLATRLLSHPDVLLLDEPTNHIDTASAAWIERFLEEYAGTCVLVTHDRYFLDRIVTRIVEIEFGRLLSFPGAYADFLEYKAGVEEVRENTERNRRTLLRNELAWMRRGAQARTTKQKARIQRCEVLQQQGPAARHREFAFEIPAPARLSKTILVARNVAHGYGDTVLFRDFNLILQYGMRIGVIGENGCGKTTLLRVLMGLEEARKGLVIRGDTTEFLYVDQTHEEVNPAHSVLQFVSDGQRYWDVGSRRIYVPAYLEKFLFDKAAVDVPMGNLSGGERNRLDLARKLLRGGNFLVLDEPTNDLDLYTLRVLEEAILDFDGCALIVSHDRYFLNRVCTHLLLFEPGGHIVHITGNYDDYLLYCERKDAETTPKRGEKRPEPVCIAQTGARRLTYLEKKELDCMEAAILDAETELHALQARLGDPAFYQRAPEEIRGTLASMDAAKARIDALYARWEDLESRS